MKKIVLFVKVGLCASVLALLSLSMVPKQVNAATGFHCDPPDTRKCATSGDWTLYGTPHVTQIDPIGIPAAE